MFEVMAKNSSVSRIVYSVKEDPVRGITYFLIFERCWMWMNSVLYEPLPNKGENQ